MSERHVEIKAVCSYNGHSINPNGNMNLKMKSAYSELTDYIKLIQFLNNDVSVTVQLPNEKPMNIGVFRVNAINVDHDGEGNLTFNSIVDSVELNNINQLSMTDKGTPFKATFEAEIEVTDENGEADWDDGDKGNDEGDWDDNSSDDGGGWD